MEGQDTIEPVAGDDTRPGLAGQRVAFERVERERLPDGNVRLRCVLRIGDDEYGGEARSESGEPLEQRAAAVATLHALDAALGRAVGLRLVGIKQIRAFDADIVIVSIWTTGAPTKHLVGSVPVTAGSSHAAALAVLDACNRYLRIFFTDPE